MSLLTAFCVFLEWQKTPKNSSIKITTRRNGTKRNGRIVDFHNLLTPENEGTFIRDEVFVSHWVFPQSTTSHIWQQPIINEQNLQPSFTIATIVRTGSKQSNLIPYNQYQWLLNNSNSRNGTRTTNVMENLHTTNISTNNDQMVSRNAGSLWSWSFVQQYDQEWIPLQPTIYTLSKLLMASIWQGLYY